jgi:hypothetical protein
VYIRNSFVTVIVVVSFCKTVGKIFADLIVAQRFVTDVTEQRVGREVLVPDYSTMRTHLDERRYQLYRGKSLKSRKTVDISLRFFFIFVVPCIITLFIK